MCKSNQIRHRSFSLRFCHDVALSVRTLWLSLMFGQAMVNTLHWITLAVLRPIYPTIKRSWFLTETRKSSLHHAGGFLVIIKEMRHGFCIWKSVLFPLAKKLPTITWKMNYKVKGEYENLSTTAFIFLGHLLATKTKTP